MDIPEALASIAEGNDLSQEQTREVFQLVMSGQATPAQIGGVCFSLKNWQHGHHRARAKSVSDSGFACVSSTMLKGRSVLRLCTINPLTTQADIRETILRLAETPASL